MDEDFKLTPEMLAAWCAYEPIGQFKETMSFARVNGMLKHAFCAGYDAARKPLPGEGGE